MTLPDLPRVLKKREADWITTSLNKWILAYGKTFAWEAKHTRGKPYLNFSELAPHQEARLLQVRHGVFNYKIPDLGKENPFDGFCMAGQPALIFIKYPKKAFAITIDAFIMEREKGKKKSLTQDRAEAISLLTVE